MAGSRNVEPHASAQLELGAHRPLDLVVVADTHGRPHPNALQLFRRRKPDAILHAGDIGSPEVLDELGTVAPVFAVRGNIDARMPGLASSLDLSFRLGSETSLRLLLTHIAVHGPRLRADAARTARRLGASLVVCGHSHVPFIGRDKGLSIFNPGSLGPRRFQLPITFGVMRVSSSRVTLGHVSAETGDDWMP